MKIVVGVCGYKDIKKLTHLSLSQLMSCPEPQFHESLLKPIAGADVYRSLLATEFIKTNYDAVLFVDDDIVFNPRDVVKLANHLKDGKHLVGGAYVTKSEKPQITSRLFEGQTVKFVPDSKPVRIKYLAGGFVMASRKLIEEVAQRMKRNNTKEAMSFYPMFMPFQKRIPAGVFHWEYEYITEDYSFSDRATEAGFDVWLDPSIRLGHVGEKVYTLEDAADTPEQSIPELAAVKA